MKACENHDEETIVVFNGDVCPFCKMEKDLKTIADVGGHEKDTKSGISGS
jgi:glutaredoxin